MPLMQAQAGPLPSKSVLAGQPVPPMGNQTELLVNEIHGKFYTQAYNGAVFTAAQAVGGVAVTNVGTTASFALANPANSGKNVSVIRIEAAIKVLPGTPIIGYYGLYLNTNPVAAAVTGTALSVLACPFGSNNQPVAKPFTTATLPASPALYRIFQQKTTTAEAPIAPPNPFSLEFDGACLLAPGSTISLMQDAGDTSNATMVCVVTWEEIPI